MFELINCAPHPHIGESKTLSFLRQHLQDGYHVVLTNYYLPEYNSTLEIDLVVINTFGVWLLEVKEWVGRIKADDILWQQVGRRPVSSPLKSIDRKAKVMHSLLSRGGEGLQRLSVNGFVVLSRGRARLDISDKSSDRVFGLDAGLIQALTTTAFQVRTTPLLASKDIQRVRDLLVSRRVDPGHQLIGGYRIVRELRRDNGMSEYEAEHTELGRKARVKRFQIAEIVSQRQLDEHIHRFKRDVAALAILGPHPNLLVAYDFLKDEHSDEFYYLILEWVRGQTLREALADVCYAPLRLQIDWVYEIARALVYCHDHDVIHRNLTPDNIFLTEEGHIKIGNFDFAKAPALGGTISITGQPLVRTKYTAPEQINKPAEVDGRADIYALGMIWYDLLNGRFDDQPIDLDQLDTLSLPSEILATIRQMGSERTAARYALAATLVDDLEVLRELV